ncbi:hypothetical protein PF008_g25017 [Phytophthora fragariae]|uniref:Uncharacterized protein n=1 Tax=Phytophthora fragariae TaxID=53985 RepID=A0A6G0QL77_9STRA|nr:hypothetical protein PF008_g25017 [Phytophthora fragariae]
MRGPCACSSSSRLPARAGLALVVLPPLSCNGNTSTSTDSPGATPSSMRGPCACSSSSRLPARAGLALAVLLLPPCPATGTPPPWKGLHRSRVAGAQQLAALDQFRSEREVEWTTQCSRTILATRRSKQGGDKLKCTLIGQLLIEASFPLPILSECQVYQTFAVYSIRHYQF